MVPCVTAAAEAPNGVGTTVFTAFFSSVAFIDVYGTTKKIRATKHELLCNLDALQSLIQFNDSVSVSCNYMYQNMQISHLE